MFDRHVEGGLLDVLKEEGIGCIVFSPLAQGLLTERYLGGIPTDSRAGKGSRFLRPENVNEEALGRARQLAALARQRGQTLAQLAVTWILRKPEITSVLIGASRATQIEDCMPGFLIRNQQLANWKRSRSVSSRFALTDAFRVA
jgi:L-glyceraldehyde 3-phosphate reductase